MVRGLRLQVGDADRLTIRLGQLGGRQAVGLVQRVFPGQAQLDALDEVAVTMVVGVMRRGGLARLVLQEEVGDACGRSVLPGAM